MEILLENCQKGWSYIQVYGPFEPVSECEAYMKQFLQFGIYSIFTQLSLNDKATLLKISDGITDILKAEGIDVNNIPESLYQNWLL